MAVPADTVYLVTLKPVGNKAEIRFSGGPAGVIYSVDDGEWVGETPPKAVIDQVKAALHIIPGLVPKARKAPKK